MPDERKTPMDPNVEPPGYKPPTSAEELLERYGKGERYFVGASLASADLRGKTLRRANLSEADLGEANLAGGAFAERTSGKLIFTGPTCAGLFSLVPISETPISVASIFAARI